MSAPFVEIPEQEFVLPGTRTCAGCGLALAYRYILKALGQDTIVTLPACCLTILHGIYPKTPIAINAVNNTFASTAASAAGLAAGLKVTGKDNFTVLAMAGDGGTFDMGIQALSGAAERQTNFIYVCYDNEAYMNTGVQRSSATPQGALTTTTPVRPKEQPKKDFLTIMEAHNPSYLATCCSSYPRDIYEKFKKAKEKDKTRFLHVAVPCPPGWGFPASQTVKVGRLAVETALVVLFEIDEGTFRLTGKSLTMARSGRKKPVVEYLKKQDRFKKMTEEQIESLQQEVDKRWEYYLNRANM